MGRSARAAEIYFRAATCQIFVYDYGLLMRVHRTSSTDTASSNKIEISQRRKSRQVLIFSYMLLRQSTYILLAR
jgi:hypothetical protein